jgi:sodium-independent sulfate anion transporter 11
MSLNCFVQAATFGFVCGLVEFVMGLLNLGLLVKFVSQPVISAFSTAVAFQVH